MAVGANIGLTIMYDQQNKDRIDGIKETQAMLHSNLTSIQSSIAALLLPYDA